MRTNTRVLSILVISILLIPSTISADEPFGVKLMRPDSLAGWDHGKQPATGWAIAEGRLSGTADSTPLLSGFTAGDFQLRFAWSVDGDGAWKILMPEVPSGKGLELILREGDGCGRLTDGETELAPGAKVEAAADSMHTAAMRRADTKFSLTVDDRQIYEVDLRPDRRFGLGLAVLSGESTLAELRGEEPLGEPIFNGTDFAGWWTPGDITKWQVENNEMVRAYRARDYLRTERQYANYTLSLQYKMRQGGNSGLGIRTPPAGWPSSDGMELQWWDREGMGCHDQMGIYGNVPPLGRADKSEQWNSLVVKADGRMISAWENGELVQQFNTFEHPELKHRNLKGWIGFQDHGAWIRVRDVRLFEAPDGLGLDAWYQPRPKRATVAIVDRLMNPETLSLADGIQSGSARKTVSGDNPSRHVLAELTGPGAVVRIVRGNDNGRLAFYFDGQDQPRIECDAGSLPGCVPQLCEDSNPLLTCVTYQKSLQIILRDATEAQYRVDYVSFPADYQLETFIDPKSGFPRGWLSPVVYRHQKFSGGARRMYDSLPRFGGERKTIEPGKTEPLVRADGAGIVQFVRLQAGRSVLDNNDLWLELTVDGEDHPAVSAPARFWFPGLIGGGNFDNFVMLDQEGPTNTLAIPFADGVTIAARNGGQQPIPGVGVWISVQPATDQTREQITNRMRLRGVFQPAATGNNGLIVQQGAGRWVAWIYQQPDGQPTTFDALTVDDRVCDGWTGTSLDTFLGQGGDFRKCLSGRHGGLCWRYLWLAPVEFQRSLLLKANGNQVGGRLALFYLKK